MSISGPKPKPTRLKKLQGNPGKRPLNGREPKPKSAVKRPWGLGQGLQRKFWDEHADELERIEILTGIDTAAFRLMAEHYSFAVQAARELHALGELTVEGREGPKKHPLVQVLRDNSQLFKSYAAEFGMTPSARTRLKLPDEAEQLSLADRLFQAVTEARAEEDDD
jgi:P27 family predicted phage terminase small subunit